MTRLQGKRALITGGTTGIGLETAREFIAEGARVVITGNNPANLEEAAKVLGDKALILRADASDIDAQASLARQIETSLGGLDVVFVNAGVAEFRPIEAWDAAAFDRSFNINIRGPYFLLQALVPLLANPSSIVLNASINAHIGMPNSSVYAATKAALLSLARTLSGELIGRGIRVNAVSPGPISTPLYGKLGLTPEQLDETAQGILGLVKAGRFGDASEIAKAVVYLASDETRFAVGSELIVDGGLSL
ncbi:MAG: SDR family oxidoreductase [Burkholderiales bacterium]|nr:SDR family oxidoreductase [Burkholderiales bacterium]